MPIRLFGFGHLLQYAIALLVSAEEYSLINSIAKLYSKHGLERRYLVLLRSMCILHIGMIYLVCCFAIFYKATENLDLTLDADLQFGRNMKAPDEFQVLWRLIAKLVSYCSVHLSFSSITIS